MVFLKNLFKLSFLYLFMLAITCYNVVAIKFFLTRTSLRNGVLFVLAGRRGWHACVGDVLAWVAWVACLRGWRASVGGMLLLFLLLLLKYYPKKKT